MSTLSGLLDLSRSALLADQAALNITANNVANQDTPGYVDQVATWQTADTVTLSGGGSTAEASTVTTTSQRDRVLEQRVQQQTQAQAGTAAEAAVLSQVEGVFSITGSSDSAGSTQIGTALNGFFSSLTALAANPSDEPTQQAALTAAGTLAAAFNAAASGIAGVQSSIDGSLASSVTAVNALTKTIASLNEQIGALSPNADAGTLEDQRQTAIAQLSQYVGLDQITTESNGITLTTTGGTALVSGDQSYALTSSQSATGTTIYDSTGAEATTGITGGSIGGQLAAQNTALPAVITALDALAYRIATVVNTQNEAGQTSAGVAGAAIFAVPASANGAAAELAVIPTNPGAIATAGLTEGATGNTNITALANLESATDSSGHTVLDDLSSLLSNVGSNSSSLSSLSDAQQASLTQLTTQRDSLSGVNLDTEASNLTTYQRSYQAAAQVLTIVDQLLASAINLGTETTVS